MILSLGCVRSKEPTPEEIQKLQTRIESGKPSFVSKEARSQKAWEWTRNIYRARQFRPVWSIHAKVDPSADEALMTLENAPADGLNPEDFGVSEIRRMESAKEKSTQLSNATDFDVHLMYSLARFAGELCAGRIDAKDVDPMWQVKPKNCDIPQIVSTAIENKQVQSLPEQLAPRLPEYAALKQSLKDFRAMNPPPQDRIETIAVNMDRMRWIADDFEPRYLRVNVPAFELTVHDGNEIALQSRVIVGADDKRTPIISGEMQRLVFSPYWNIPLSIATKEVLPKVKKDPRYLDRQQMEVVRMSHGKAETVDPSQVDWDKQSDDDFDYQLRQRPGASNALGLVKFIFPNPFNIYLHDTNADNLFAKLTRSLSHGCIRVEKAPELAAYVLQDQPEWTPERINAAMHSGEEKWVNLKKRLPVHIVYWTAWVKPDEDIQFSEDVYGYDAKHKLAWGDRPMASK
jgi:murein L,D-transpeptidase YcbB/YkuD